MLLLENRKIKMRHSTIELQVFPNCPTTSAETNLGPKSKFSSVCTKDLLFHRRKATSLVKSSRPDWATWGIPILKSVFWAMEPDKGACHQASQPVFTPLNLHGGRRTSSCTLANCTLTTQAHTLNKWNEEKRILIFPTTK